MEPFQIFISWSGQKSWHLAHRLAEWIPSIIHNCRFYVSSENIPSGALWLNTLKKELVNTKMALICVTKDNIQSQWLNFEAGAIWNRFEEGILICPVLLDVNIEALIGPLAHFQARRFNERDMKSLVKTLAERSGFEGDRPDRLDLNFKTVWPQLERDVRSDVASVIDEPNVRVNAGIDEFESAGLQIMSYLNHNNLDSIPFETVRKRIDPLYTDEFLLNLIKRQATKFRRANFRDGRLGIGRSKIIRS